MSGFPYWYPVYTDYPYYYDYPPAVVYNNGYYANDNGYVPPVVVGSGDTTAPESSTAQVAPSYNELGAAWGQDLRRDIVTWAQFVAYVKASVLTAPPAAQADFREGFISGYGPNGAAAYDKAAAQAAGPSAQQQPKIINMPPSN